MNSKVLVFIILLVFSYFLPQFKKVPTVSRSTVLSVNTSKSTGKSSDTEKQEAQVLRVVDGDTIEILLDNKKEKVRIIGINTPETVDLRKPVECFGKEASDKAKSLLTDQTVTLESDPTQSDKDKYGRILRYIYLSDGTDFGLKMISEGYAYEYTYDIPYTKQTQYKKAQKNAEMESLGLWNSAICNGQK